VEVVRLYHVLDGVVYEVPSLQAVLRARLVRLSWLLGSAFRAVQEVTAPDAAAAQEDRAEQGARAAAPGKAADGLGGGSPPSNRAKRVRDE